MTNKISPRSSEHLITALLLLLIHGNCFTLNRNHISVIDERKILCHTLPYPKLTAIASSLSTITDVTHVNNDGGEDTVRMSTVPPKHPLFSHTNLVHIKTTPPEGLWTHLLPPITKPTARGIDVSITFSNPDEGAEHLLDACHMPSNNCIKQHLELCLRSFTEIIPLDNFAEGKKMLYKARIVSSRGKVGVKCPRWHVDHVPVRLILALEGPGVCYMECNGSDLINLERVNDSDDVNTYQANKGIIEWFRQSDIDAVEKRSKRGDVMILMGKEWESEGSNAVVHKSPQLRPFQGRVLLTVDITECC